jgi:hypothetical protein
LALPPASLTQKEDEGSSQEEGEDSFKFKMPTAKELLKRPLAID